jgi:hypothetical protein
MAAREILVKAGKVAAMGAGAGMAIYLHDRYIRPELERRHQYMLASYTSLLTAFVALGLMVAGASRVM